MREIIKQFDKTICEKAGKHSLQQLEQAVGRDFVRKKDMSDILSEMDRNTKQRESQTFNMY